MVEGSILEAIDGGIVVALLQIISADLDRFFGAQGIPERLRRIRGCCWRVFLRLALLRLRMRAGKKTARQKKWKHQTDGQNMAQRYARASPNSIRFVIIKMLWKYLNAASPNPKSATPHQ